MEIILELFLTAFIALLFSFLIAKIVSLALGGDSGSGVEAKSLIDAGDEIIMEELEFAEKLEVQGLESEKRVEFIEESADKVDVFETGQVGVDQDSETEFKNKVEYVQETADKVDEFEAGEGEVLKGSKAQAFESEKQVELWQETTMKVDDFDAEKAEEVKLDDDDDEWEGIEKSELEKVFEAASKFVELKGDSKGLGNDVQMELYGLHKIATEGPCRQSLPLAFMPTSRSKWNAWQRLGNMNPDAAMEQYVAILSDSVPGWMEDNSNGKRKLESADRGVPGAMAPDINSLPDQQTSFTQERNAESKSATGGGYDITEGTSFEKQAKD